MRIKNTATKICVFTIGLIFANASFGQNSTGRDSTRSLTGKDSTDIFHLIGTLPTANPIVFTAPTYTAPPRVQGICGSDNNATVYTTPTGLCSSGIPSSVTFNGSTYNWSCSGQWGGNNSSCSAVPPPVQGICGSDNATTVYSTPTRLCSSGIPSAVSFNGSTYSWSCSGQYGGSNRSCSAAQYVPPPPYIVQYEITGTQQTTNWHHFYFNATCGNGRNFSGYFVISRFSGWGAHAVYSRGTGPLNDYATWDQYCQ